MSYVLVSRSEPVCPFCIDAEDLLNSKGVEFEIINLSGRHTAMQLFKAYGNTTVPLILKNGEVIGGCQDLMEHFAELEALAQNVISEIRDFL